MKARVLALILALPAACAAPPSAPPNTPPNTPSGTDPAFAGSFQAQSEEIELWGEWVFAGAALAALEALDQAGACVHRGDLEAAIALVDQALATLPFDPHLLKARAAILVQMRFLRAAEIELERAARFDPDCCFTWWALGLVRQDLGLTRSAAQALQVAFDLGQRDPALLLLFAEVERRNGELHRAASFYLVRARVLEREGHREQALDAYREALETEIDPRQRRLLEDLIASR